jgi:hypothetical protein
MQQGALAAMGLLAGLSGCGSDPSRCPLGDAGPSEEASDDATGPGGLMVHGTFTNTTCPLVNPLGASPDNGGLVELIGSVTGLTDAATPTYSWTTSNGIFTDPHALDTTFRCIAVGATTVTLTVTLGDCHGQASLDLDCDVLTGGGN